jgi:hypothetical protein
MIRITVRSQTEEPEVDVGVLTGSGSKRAKLIEGLRAADYMGLVKDEPDDLVIASAISWRLINVMAEPGPLPAGAQTTATNRGIRRARLGSVLASPN